MYFSMVNVGSEPEELFLYDQKAKRSEMQWVVMFFLKLL
jgi:hypothetical protein